jgi:hypothetical protein
MDDPKFILASTAKARGSQLCFRASSGNEYASFDARRPQTAQSGNKTDPKNV